MMETKILINALRECKKPYTVMLDVSAEMIADRLEELEKQNEAMLKELCDKENLVREAEGRFYELKKELDTLKNATKKQSEPEWISVEDEPVPHDRDIAKYFFPDDMPCVIRYYGNGEKQAPTHWMRVEPPKPKEPTFKDVFLEKFPKANYDLIVEALCVCAFFPQFDVEKNVCRSEICEQCWNQPYFEEEGEADA